MYSLILFKFLLGHYAIFVEGYMKIVILGGVAAGTKVAAKLKREDRNKGSIYFRFNAGN